MTTRRALAGALVVLFTLAAPSRGLAFLELGFSLNGQVQALKWGSFPVRYYVTNQTVGGVDPPAFQGAVARAFATWEALPTAATSYTFAGYTDALPGEDDGLSTLGFVNRPDLDRVLASTSFLVDAASGAVLESDIFFNSAFAWSTSDSGDANRYDLQTIALHEIGHLSGLSHSALGETEVVNDGRRLLASDAVMFPIAFGRGVLNRVLRDDDIAGVSDLYPDAGIKSRTGSLSGRITKNGAGVYGAHIVAFNPATGVMIGGFSLNAQGDFVISGLSPGTYVVRVEPLDDADTASFLDGPIDVDFRVTYFSRLVAVARAGDSGTTEIAVLPK